MTSPDATSFDRLFEHRAWVRGLVRSLVLDSARADDIEQQVWLSALRDAPPHLDRPRAWLAAVARNWARRAHRGESRRARREAAVARPEAAPTGADTLERAEAHRRVVEAVLALPEPLRLAVLLHYFDGLSAADAAARLGVPHETVRSRLRLARTRLRDDLAPADAAGRAVFAPALLALADLPSQFALPATTTISGGTIAMAASQKIALAVVVPAAAGVAWITARAAATEPPVDRTEEVGALVARVERLERSAEAPRARPSEDRALTRRIDELEARLAALPQREAVSDPARTAAVPAPAPDLVRGGPRAGTEVDGARDQAERDRTSEVAKLVSDYGALTDGLKADPGSAEHRAAMRRLAEQLVKCGEPPVAQGDLDRIAAMLDGEARRARVSATEADDAATILHGLAPGHAARPGLASAVAGGWAKDDRLPGFLAGFAANAEPKVHHSMLVILDRTPSAAFSDYVVRLVRDERDPGVLASALDADRIEAAATQDAAPRVAQAVEARLADGTLEPKLRSRAGCALAIASLRSPETGAAALRRIADGETDAKLAERFRAAAAALLDRSANAKSLEKAFK